MNDKIKSLLKEPSTYLGLGMIIAAAIGMETGSGEQIATVLAGVVGVFLPEGNKAS